MNLLNLKKCALMLSFIISSGVAAEAQLLEKKTIKIIQLTDVADDVFWSPLTDSIREDGAGSTAFMSVDWSRGVGSFSGALKLDKNGKGFSSYRAFSQWDLSKVESLKFEVRGDGRTYKVLLKDKVANSSKPESDDYSFQAQFKTTPGEVTEVEVPLEKFEAIYRGRKVSGLKLDPSQVESIGLQINDGIEGAFSLEFGEIEGVLKLGE